LTSLHSLYDARTNTTARVVAGVLLFGLVASLFAGTSIRAADAMSSAIIVQQSNAGCSGSSCSVSVTLNSIVPGDLLVVGVASTGNLVAVTDSQALFKGFSETLVDGDCYTQLPESCAVVFAEVSPSGGSDTITDDVNPCVGCNTVTLVDLYVYELSGVSYPSGSVGRSAGFGDGCYAPCTDSISTSGSPLPYVPGDFLLAIIADSNGGSTMLSPAAGFMQSTQNSGDKFGFAEHSIPLASSSTSFQASIQGIGTPAVGPLPWAEVGVLIPASGGSLGVPEFPLGLALLFALLFPALLVLRKKTQSFRVFSV
jgi:hypothetical protein